MFSNVICHYRRIAFLLSLCLCAAMLGGFATHARGQDGDEPLLEREPFDRITLDAENDNAQIEVFPLAFPNRELPGVSDRRGNLRVTLLTESTRKYDINWTHITKIELFEGMILEEAQRLSTEKKLDEAFDYFTYLTKHYSNLPGLDAALHRYLYINAGELFRANKNSEALGVIEELVQRNPNYQTGSTRTLMDVLASIAEKMLVDLEAKGDFGSARLFIKRLANDYGNVHKALIDRWRAKFAAAAVIKRDQARQLVTQEKFLDANNLAREMMNIWPQVEGGKALLAQLAAKYPILVVGVAQPGIIQDSQRIHDWSARRTSRLIERSFLEFQGPGVEGGRYDCFLARVERSENRRQLIFNLRQGEEEQKNAVTGFDVSRRLMALSDPASQEYFPAWSGLMKGVTVEDVMRVTIDLRRPHVLPEAFLQTLMRDPGNLSSPPLYRMGPYLVGEIKGEESFFEINKQYTRQGPAQPTRIIEKYLSDRSRSYAALKRGEVDVLDRVFPADVLRLKDNDDGITIGQYAIPTVHMLVPNHRSPYLANRQFRRALIYAIDRNTILKQLLLGGEDLEGCRVISGPFPIGMNDSDPLAYAYDEKIKPLDYDPVMGFVLTKLATRQIAITAEIREEKAPPLTPLVLCHPAGEVPRIACAAMAKQISRIIGVDCLLKELPPGAVDDAEKDYDLLYVEASIAEPVVDSRRLFGAGGLVDNAGPYVGQSLRLLDRAESWPIASRRLQDIHRSVYDFSIVIPLWQISEHFAYRARIQNIEQKPVSLYQNIENWRLVPVGN